MRPQSFLVHGRCTAGETVLTSDTGTDIHRPHGLDVWTLNYTRAGIGRVDAGARRLLVRPGDLLLFRPGVVNDYGRDSQRLHWVHLWTVFHPPDDWQRWLAWPEWTSGIMRLDVADARARRKIMLLLQEMVAVMKTHHRQRDEIAMGLLLAVLVWCDTANPLSGRRQLDPRIQRVIAHLCDHHAAPFCIAELAEMVGLSASRFSHLFRDQMGTSPMQFLEGERMTRACDLLLMTGEPVGAIAVQVGFEDQAYFTRVFRRRFGCTPRAYRRRGRPSAVDADRAPGP